MNHTLKHRSNLVMAAEHAHNQRKRPASFGEIVMAEYNQDAPFRAMAKAAFHIDLIVTAIIVGLIALVWSL